MDALWGRTDQPAVTRAALLSMVTGFVTLVGCALVGTVLFDPTIADWFFPVVLTVAVTQVTAAVLLIAGGVRLARGAGRRMFVAGNVLHVLLCAAYVLHALAVVANNSADPPSTVVAMVVVPIVFAALPVTSLVMAR
ncbi:hypothetical protein [Actinophytocola sp.]|uniref:hypothetical protein n=1 Tax=Actinophytocola sp. TaxID=1872138 RepID=UPI002ED13BD1